MAQLIKGQGGRGTALAYDAPQDTILRVEAVTFALSTGGEAGPHYVLVGLGDALESVVTVAVSPDGTLPGITSQYSFGVGYVNAAVKNATGELKEATAALPQIDLQPGGRIRIAANLETGTIASNDLISLVRIYADVIPIDQGVTFGVPGPIVLIAGAGAP